MGIYWVFFLPHSRQRKPRRLALKRTNAKVGGKCRNVHCTSISDDSTWPEGKPRQERERDWGRIPSLSRSTPILRCVPLRRGSWNRLPSCAAVPQLRLAAALSISRARAYHAFIWTAACLFCVCVCVCVCLCVCLCVSVHVRSGGSVAVFFLYQYLFLSPVTACLHLELLRFRTHFIHRCVAVQELNWHPQVPLGAEILREWPHQGGPDDGATFQVLQEDPGLWC